MLSADQKKQLRSRGQTLEVSLTVGKNGLSDSVVTSLIDLFRHHDLVKIRLPASSPKEREHLALQAANRVEAEIVGHTGRTWLLYRQIKQD
jgi:RNA-binding protein YhbY